MVKVPDTVN